MRRTQWLLAFLILAASQAEIEAGLFHRKGKEEVPGGSPPNLVAPNGVVVPRWASKRMRESPVPLYGQSWGRRPWAMPLNTQGTASAFWARADGNGFGAGPVPGYTNGPALGNVPTAPVGPDGSNPLLRRTRSNPLFPFFPYEFSSN